MKKLDQKAVKNAISNLLREEPIALQFFNYLNDRKRTAAVTDLSHILIYVREAYFHGAQKSELLAVVKDLAKVGICSVKGLPGREKIHWKHWPFPIFAANNTDLLGIEFKEVASLQADKNLFRSVKQQIDIYRAQILAGTGEKLPDLVLVASQPSGVRVLTDYTTEEILKELKRRGLELKLIANK